MIDPRHPDSEDPRGDAGEGADTAASHDTRWAGRAQFEETHDPASRINPFGPDEILQYRNPGRRWRDAD